MNTDSSFAVEVLSEFSEEEAEKIRSLVKYFGDSGQPLSNEALQEIVSSKTTHLYVAREINTKEIVGMVTLSVYRIPDKITAWIDDLVVDEAARGHGLGKQLLLFAVDEAKKKNAVSVNLTSNPSRESANLLYEKVGFEKRVTNVYRITF